MTSKGETIVRVLDEELQIALNERLKQVHVKHSYGAGVDLEPSGRLRLRVGPDYSSAGIADDPPRLIESQLNRLVAGLVRRALTVKRERALDQERERRWRLHDEKRRRQEQERQSEALRRRRLRVLARRWIQHQRVSQFVANVEQRIRDERLDGETREVATRWVQWAKRHLREGDPVEALLNEPWPSTPMPPAMPMRWRWE